MQWYLYILNAIMNIVFHLAYRDYRQIIHGTNSIKSKYQWSLSYANTPPQFLQLLTINPVHQLSNMSSEIGTCQWLRKNIGRVIHGIDLSNVNLLS